MQHALVYCIDRRDSGNPTFRRIRLQDLDLTPGADSRSIILQAGPFFVDLHEEMH